MAACNCLGFDEVVFKREERVGLILQVETH